MAKQEQPFYYGGQAVIEGVMMRGRHTMATSVRKQDGSIVMREVPIGSITRRYPILKLPFIRGTVALIEAMVLGMKSLTYSAQQFADEEEEELGTKELVFSALFAITLTILLFIVLPAFLITTFVQPHFENPLVINFAEGIIKMTFFLAYIWGISFMKDIRRVFEYHGAEHKAINCYEAGDELTVENVQRHTRFHKRCGTSFIVFVLLIGIVVFAFFGKPPFPLRALYQIAILPIVAGISYEIIRMAGREGAPRIFDWLSRPGIWTQMITTKEPDDSQVEVAIHSLNAVIARDREAEAAIARLDDQRRKGVADFAG